MFFTFKYHINLFFIFIFIILIGCKLQEPLKSHGIIYLENRSIKLTVNVSNLNDVIKTMGKPHIKEEEVNSSSETWIYFERTLTKGQYHKLGQHVLKDNNVLVLNFDKYGVLSDKKFITKEAINKIQFSKKYTENELSQKSFVQKFLQSIKQKMYSNK
jgi:outer membrane protein assembly factor BamE (lipoprotein component of BamABCDE complex)